MKTQGNTAEAIKTLQTALSLINKRRNAGSAGRATRAEFSTTDKVNNYKGER